MKPFSENVIFLDTEFSSLDPYKGEILSIGLVKISGEELYLELEFEGEVDDWPKEHILPTLINPKVSRDEAKKQIKDFVGENKPFAISFANQFDAIYVYKLFGVNDHPFNWLPIDFASILFGMNINPDIYFNQDKDQFYKKIGLDISTYNEHHALEDAKQLRAVYLKFVDRK